ncbi:MAG: hypothetical protein UV59_C0006G0032 [Candidatus Gottesmanbacteria bacterium GW2011_GWA1_43_11]|uniref:DUF4012 domain-containing protein n=1 Tax=Candidatus Gottesmanbacteria bacterium GW2011_GWA1_43_11 TaxID=1618436 RepID=A0A0G1ER89_9BACT|nr:MAG: hypothetical protein UV59_C0006G0032 [Candidatus Gottesmanbacteria bacterium GW2011_GWA1_43_11]
MDTSRPPQFTVTEREGNPKAVFFGSELDLVNQLALSLSEHGVDLFSGKSLADAFFGDYFFYVGRLAAVKDFLDASGKDLPKTLLLLRGVSDYAEVEKCLTNFPQLKAVTIGDEIELTEQRADRVMEFFFTASEQILKLGKLSPVPAQRDNLLEELPVRTVEKQESSLPLDTVALAPEVELAKREEPETGRIRTEMLTSPASEAKFEVTKERAPAQSVLTAELTKPALTNVDVREPVARLFNSAHPKPTGTQTPVPNFKKRAPIFKAITLGLLIFLLFPLVIFAGEISLIGFHGWRGRSAFNSARYQSATGHFRSANFYTNAAKKQLELSESLFALFHKRGFVQRVIQLINIVDKSTRAAQYGAQAAEEAVQLVRGVTGSDKGVSFGQLISSMKGNLTLVDGELATAQAEYKTESLQSLLGTWPFHLLSQKFSNWFEELGDARNSLIQARLALSMAPEVLGLYGDRKYLLLLQNNMELRPTGGFIGSYGLVSFANGELKEFKVEDVYTADGALKGHVDPPLPLQKHLGQEHWYLRDSNWDPDFVASGARAAWFFDKEMGESVDGVLAVDVSFLESLLGTIGEIELKDYQETLTAENIFMKTQSYAQSEFFPGSTQKRDFLGAVARQLVDELLQGKKLVNMSLLSAIERGLEEHHLQLYFNSPALLAVVDALGWSGRLDTRPACEAENCVNDFLAVVDANLGVNKTDYFVNRSVKDEIALAGSGVVTHSLSLEYENKATTDETGLGDFYKNYVRVFVPKGAVLKQATFGTQPLAIISEGVASTSATLITENSQLTSFEQLLEVPPQSKQTLSLIYDLVAAPAATLVNQYQLKVRKQAGILAPEYVVTVRVPENWTMVSVSPEKNGEVAGVTSLVNEAGISYNNDLRQDELIKLNFSQR